MPVTTGVFEIRRQSRLKATQKLEDSEQLPEPEHG
jgi:hypothetical protein